MCKNVLNCFYCRLVFTRFFEILSCPAARLENRWKARIGKWKAKTTLGAQKPVEYVGYGYRAYLHFRAPAPFPAPFSTSCLNSISEKAESVSKSLKLEWKNSYPSSYSETQGKRLRICFLNRGNCP